MSALAWVASHAFWCKWGFSWASESVGHLLEVALVSFSSRLLSERSVPEGIDAAEAAASVHGFLMFGLMVVWFWKGYWCLFLWFLLLCTSVGAMLEGA